MPRNARSLVVAGVFSSITALLLFFVQRRTLGDLDAIFVVLSGMTAMGAITALARYAEERSTPADFSINADFLVTAIGKTVAELQAQDRMRSLSPFPSEEVGPGHFVGVDNSLALAKLRIDLERELRRLAREADASLPDRPVGILRLAQELVNMQVLPENLVYPLKDVAALCNRAVHGYDVSDQQATAVLEVGERLIQAFRALDGRTRNRPTVSGI